LIIETLEVDCKIAHDKEKIASQGAHRFIFRTSGLCRSFTLLSISLLVLAIHPAYAGSDTGVLLAGVQGEWAHIKYQLPENQRKAAFRKLYGHTKQIRITHPGKAGPLLWEGIILTDYAGERGGLRALQMIK